MKSPVIFKECNQYQIILFPASYDDYYVSQNHPVCIINQTLDGIDISNIEAIYKGGLSSANVLYSAAIVNSKVLGMEREFGAIKVGKPASFLVDKTNPLNSVKTWAKPLYVLKRGIVYLGEELRSQKSLINPIYTPYPRPKEEGEDFDEGGELLSLFKSMDTNGDNHLTEDEVPAQQRSKFKSIDANGDEKVSQEEFSAAF